MAGIINASLNLQGIPKDKIVDGKKGKYINVTITINDEPDKFGQHCNIVVQQSKEERENKEAKTYLGNGKVAWTNGSFPSKLQQENNNTYQQQSSPAPADDLPF